jgi:branched-chain amino acid transport system permease protein
VTATAKRAMWMVGATVLTIGAAEVLGATAGVGIPPEVLIQAALFGCINAMIAVGLVLVYRATRVINFAQAGFGVVASVGFLELMTYEHWSYWLAFPASVLGAAALGFLTELFLIRRFVAKTRLVLTVVTIAVAQLLSVIALSIPGLLGDDGQSLSKSKTFHTPFSSLTHKYGVVVFNGNHLVLLVATVLVVVGMTAFFKLSSVGIAIRAAAENDDRAALLGINTTSLSMIVWIVAGGLAGLAAVLQLCLGIGGGGAAALAGGGAALGLGTMLRVLFAAILGDMENLPTTVLAAILLSVFESAVFFAYSQTAVVDVLVLGLTIGVLLLRRKTLARAGEGTEGSWAASEEIRPIPTELAALPTVKSGVRRVFVFGGIVMAALPWILSPSQTDQAGLFAIYGIIVVSIVVLTGWGGQISLGQFGFVAVGAVVGGALIDRAGWPFPIALLVGSLVGAGVAVVLGLPALRIKGLYLAVTTLAFAVVASTVLLNQRYFGSILPVTVNRPKLFFIRFEDARAFYYLCVLSLGGAVAAALGIRRSRTGRVLIAMRDNERTAQSFGVNLVRTRLATFAISGFLAAFAGVLYAAHQHAVTQSAFGPEQSITLFLMAIIGGLGSVPGALTGALYLGALTIVSSSPIVHGLASSGGVLFFLLAFPGGLGSAVYKVRDSVLRRVAIRRRIYVPSLLGEFGMVGGQMARVPLAPKAGEDPKAPAASPRFRRRSRIGVAGGSQVGKGWSFYGN